MLVGPWNSGIAGKGDDMRSYWTTSLLLAGGMALQAHAIMGFGLHWAPSPGFSTSAEKGSIMPSGSSDPNRVQLNTGGVSGLQGFGAKLWLDFLPFIDLEAAANVQFGYYDAAFILSGDTTQLNFDLGVPGAAGKPFFARMYGDAAVLYPFLKIPLVKVYGGAGLSYGVGTQTMTSGFARSALARAEAAGGFDADNASAAQVQSVLVDAIKDEGMISGAGFFLQAGAKLKPPIIPLAVYADAKYRFAGYKPSNADGSDLSLEIGGAIAF
jgi:hypothetical protein